MLIEQSRSSDQQYLAYNVDVKQLLDIKGGSYHHFCGMMLLSTASKVQSQWPENSSKPCLIKDDKMQPILSLSQG